MSNSQNKKIKKLWKICLNNKCNQIKQLLPKVGHDVEITEGIPLWVSIFTEDNIRPEVVEIFMKRNKRNAQQRLHTHKRAIILSPVYTSGDTLLSSRFYFVRNDDDDDVHTPCDGCSYRCVGRGWGGGLFFFNFSSVFQERRRYWQRRPSFGIGKKNTGLSLAGWRGGALAVYSGLARRTTKISFF